MRPTVFKITCYVCLIIDRNNLGNKQELSCEENWLSFRHIIFLCSVKERTIMIGFVSCFIFLIDDTFNYDYDMKKSK